MQKCVYVQYGSCVFPNIDLQFFEPRDVELVHMEGSLC